MNLEEEVEHYLAGLRESDHMRNDAAIAPKLKQSQGQDRAIVPPVSKFQPRDRKVNREYLLAGLTGQRISCNDSMHSGQEAVAPSQQLVSLKTTARSPPSSPRLDGYSAMEPQTQGFIARTRHEIVLKTLAPDHSEAEGTDGETLSEASNAVDVAADDELDIIQHYAPSKSSEASLSGQSMPAFGKDGAVTNEEEYQVLPSSSKVEEEEWDDCRVAET